jgi:hypothetical protein
VRRYQEGTDVLGAEVIASLGWVDPDQDPQLPAGGGGGSTARAPLRALRAPAVLS